MRDVSKEGLALVFQLWDEFPKGTASFRRHVRHKMEMLKEQPSTPVGATNARMVGILTHNIEYIWRLLLTPEDNLFLSFIHIKAHVSTQKTIYEKYDASLKPTDNVMNALFILPEFEYGFICVSYVDVIGHQRPH